MGGFEDIKTVVLPLLNNESVALMNLQNEIFDLKMDKDLINDPEKFFGGKTKLIKVRPVSEDEEANLLDIAEIGDRKDVLEINSGCVIKHSRLSHHWLFIPYNYEDNSEFIKIINTAGITIQELQDPIFVCKDKKQIKLIRDTYKSTKNGLNENSLILFSGTTRKCYFSQSIFHHHAYGYHWLFDDYPHSLVRQVSCVYFGDNTISVNLMDDLEKKIGKPLLSTVGVIQIPHHGSIDSFDKCIFSVFESCVFSILSFGTNNSHGHPSCVVISSIIKEQNIPIQVTENRDSAFIQYIAS